MFCFLRGPSIYENLKNFHQLRALFVFLVETSKEIDVDNLDEEASENIREFLNTIADIFEEILDNSEQQK